MHFSNSFVKVANLLAVAPGYDKAKVTVVGVSRMLSRSHARCILHRFHKTDSNHGNV